MLFGTAVGQDWSGLGSDEKKFKFSTTLLKSLIAKGKRLEQYMESLLLSLLRIGHMICLNIKVIVELRAWSVEEGRGAQGKTKVSIGAGSLRVRKENMANKMTHAAHITKSTLLYLVVSCLLVET